MRKLFYEDTRLVEWEGQIVDVLEKDNKFYVTLDCTAFYPEGGGQPSDRGLIDNIEVIDVIEENNVIYHILPSKPINKTVKCKLDFDRRLDLMQQHTGQHLFSAIFYNKYKGETSSFHLGDDYISVDISIADISPEMARDVENIANDYIFKNLNIITHIANKDDLPRFPLRKLPPTDEDIRIVEIDKLDFSPCCGTHVSRTGEIGLIKIIKTEKYKGATRIYLKCGKRALYDYQNKTDLVFNLCKYLSVPENEIFQRVDNAANEIKALTKQLLEVKEKMFKYEASELISINPSKPIIKLYDSMTINDQQLLSKAILDISNSAVLLATSIDKKILMSHNGSHDIDFGKLLKENLKNFNGKGGGNPKQAQAAFEKVEDMKSFIEFLDQSIQI